jgi:hypothetical protein
MVKTHKITGLRYLCQTKRKDPLKYLGSGKYWTRHLNQHGPHIETRILIKCYTKSALKSWGIYYSKLWSVVKSKKWANLKEESGDGGDMGPIAALELSKKYIGRRKETHPSVAAQAAAIRGRTKETHPGVAAQAAAMTGRTKENHSGTAAMALKKVGKPSPLKGLTKETHAGLAAISSKMTGPNNHQYDPTIYTFIHDDGTVETCTRFEMVKRYNLHKSHLGGVIKGKEKSHKGWRIGDLVPD